MNEQDIMNVKIRKREKIDTILAYILLVIILGAIIFILYLKFIRRDNNLDTNPEEYTKNYITLDTISNRLNNSTLANRYKNDNVIFSSSVMDNGLSISYVKDDIDVNFTINSIDSELEFITDEDNGIIYEDIYREVTSIICEYYGNTMDSCKSTVSKIDKDNVVDGIRYVSSGDNMIVYVSTTRSIEVEDIDTYTEVTKLVLSKTNYRLKLNDVVIDNIDIVTGDDSIVFNGDIDIVTGDDSIVFNGDIDMGNSNDLDVVVTLFDSNSNSLKEESYKVDENSFSIKFTFDDTLKLEDIKTYSISISE